MCITIDSVTMNLTKYQHDYSHSVKKFFTFLYLYKLHLL